MYQNILIPIDGSPISTVAARAWVKFARQLDAEIVGIFVAPRIPIPIYVKIIPPDGSNGNWRPLSKQHQGAKLGVASPPDMY